MASKERDFKELGVFPCSHQKSTDRFPPTGDVKAPPFAWYRNNLTALSQCQNLLFIAYVDKILVYKPQFPQQVISSKPELVLDLPKSKPGLVGHIEPHKPHAVNQLVVGDLGHEEIVAVVCDDGDVVAYTTRSIVNAIEQHNPENANDSQLPRDVRTILLKNVGKSAWGLAIHKTARLIAVSSNTHNISVFAFALCQEPSPENSHEPEAGEVLPTLEFRLGPEEWVHPPACSYPLIDRSTRNFEIILAGHHSNIPNVAFCNTAADPHGRYLVSTDIGGTTFVWDIWQGDILADMTPQHQIGNNEFSWNIACVDPQSCRLSNSVKETFGCQDVSPRSNASSNLRTSSPIFNNSSSPRLVPDFSERHHSFQRSITTFSGAVVHIPHSSVELLDPDDEILEITDESDESEGSANELSSNMSNTPMETEEPKPISVEDLVSQRRAGTSESVMRLWFDIKYTGGLASCSTVLCEQALHQHFPPHLLNLSHFERLNMVLQIPELGIIAVANQVGRVALLTMTKNTMNDQWGFRVEWHLPFRTQEIDGLRPDLALLGMAIGPVQGYGKMSGFARDEAGPVDGTRRFRLMLIYYDSTILSYEIWRSIADSGSGIQDRILVL